MFQTFSSDLDRDSRQVTVVRPDTSLLLTVRVAARRPIVPTWVVRLLRDTT
jgi:hypothetical protein